MKQRKSFVICSLFALSCCYISILVIWNLLTPRYQLDERFLTFDGDYVEIAELSNSNQLCDNAPCEYWNMLASYLIDPQQWIRSTHEFNFLGHPPGFQFTLPFPLFSLDPLRESFNTIYNTFISLGDLNTTQTVVYLHSGADFLRPFALHPFASTYLLLSEESSSISPSLIPFTSAGNIEELTSVQTNVLDVLLPSIHQYMLEISQGKQESPLFIGRVFPYLLAQLKFTGHHIIKVMEHNDGMECLEIIFTKDLLSKSKSLLYCSSRLVQIHPEYLSRMKLNDPFTLVLNSNHPGYFEHHRVLMEEENDCNSPLQTSNTSHRNEALQLISLVSYLLERSAFVVQSEHGIPYYWFDEKDITKDLWEARFFGMPGPLKNQTCFVDKMLASYPYQSKDRDITLSMDHSARLICENQDKWETSYWITNNQICYDENCKCPLYTASDVCSGEHQDGFLMVLSKM